MNLSNELMDIFEDHIADLITTYTVEQRHVEGEMDDMWVSIGPKRRNGATTKLVNPGEYKVTAWDAKGKWLATSEPFTLEKGNVAEVRGVEIKVR